jgi:integrase
MGRRRRGEFPRYRLHKQSGQAVVSLPIGDGKYRDVLLGPFESEESNREYTRVINEWVAAGQHPLPRKIGGRCPSLSVSELVLRFWKYAEQHYRLVDGSLSGELNHFKYALAPLVDLYGGKPAVEFGPLGLKAVRQNMIDTRWFFVRFPAKAKAGSRWVPERRFRPDQQHRRPEDCVGAAGQAEWDGKWWPVTICKTRKGLARKLVNQRIDHIKRVFKWAVSEELVPASVYEALKTVAGLRRGHPGTHERPKVRPVPWKNVEAVLPFLAPQVAAMVQLQPLMGARETEICLIRGRDLDRSGAVWWYCIDPNEVARDGQPANLHKTAHHENLDGSASIKRLPIGPKAQEILKPWLREALRPRGESEAFLRRNPAGGRPALQPVIHGLRAPRGTDRRRVLSPRMDTQHDPGSLRAPGRAGRRIHRAAGPRRDDVSDRNPRPQRHVPLEGD